MNFQLLEKSAAQLSILWKCSAVLLLAAGCASTASVDRAVQREVERAAARDQTISTNTATAAKDFIETPPAAVTNAVVTLDRNSVLQLAARYSRDLQDTRDALYGEAVLLFAARREFEVQYSGTADYVFSRAASGNTTHKGGLELDASRVLPTGARVKFSGGLTRADGDGTNAAQFAKTGTARLDQPLLAGAGYEASHSPLIQAEHEYIYALRAFSLDRQDFAIQVVRDFYDLVQQKTAVSNQLLSLDQFTYLRRRSEALFSVRRAAAIDVLRAQQQELSATNSLTSETESYAIQKSRFLIGLGLPASQQATLIEAIPELQPLPCPQDRAVELALARRPDVQTTRDRLADAERALRTARNNYRPDISLFGAGALSGKGESLTDMTDENSVSAGIVAEIPLDRRERREAVKLATLALESAKRSWQAKQDDVRLDVASNYSQLRALLNSVQIQEKNREIAERRAENANYLFKEGTLSNRDVVEAQNELLDARNAYVTALLDYEIQRLQLLRNIGLLDIAADGSLIEMTP